MDGSGSVGRTRFGLFKEFVQKLVLQLNVGEDGTKVALVQLSDTEETKFEFGINSYSNVSSILEAIGNVMYQYGKLQRTETALRMVENKVKFLQKLFIVYLIFCNKLEQIIFMKQSDLQGCKCPSSDHLLHALGGLYNDVNSFHFM